jgi:hypothetical protein
MQIKFLNAANSLWVVKREFKPDSWLVAGLISGQLTAQEVCEAYHVEKILKDGNDIHYLVNEVPEAEIVND